MLILAFDTSGLAGSVALLDGPQLLREVALQTEGGSARTLAPAMTQLLKDAGVGPQQIRRAARIRRRTIFGFRELAGRTLRRETGTDQQGN